MSEPQFYTVVKSSIKYQNEDLTLSNVFLVP